MPRVGHTVSALVHQTIPRTHRLSAGGQQFVAKLPKSPDTHLTWVAYQNIAVEGAKYKACICVLTHYHTINHQRCVPTNQLQSAVMAIRPTTSNGYHAPPSARAASCPHATSGKACARRTCNKKCVFCTHVCFFPRYQSNSPLL